MALAAGTCEVVILPDAARLAEAAAERIARAAQAALPLRGRFTLVLSGGSTPERTYQLLAAPPLVERIPWDRTYLFFGDERFVPLDDPRSNYRMARRALLEHAPVPADQVFAVDVTAASPAASAAEYAGRLARFFGLPEGGAPPRFDLILLGLGDDGHTASLFPGKPSLVEAKEWVTWSPPGILPPPVDRVTMTFPTLNAAREVMFLTAGANKAAPVARALRGPTTIEQTPSSGVRPVDGQLTWLLDQAAAERLGK